MQAHETRGVVLTEEELSRYARHLTLSEIGITGQKHLKASSVLCVGSGGLGSPILLYLAAAGVGRLGIVDFDCVEPSNLQRQVVHGMSSIAKPKTNSARDRILEINPYCQVDTFQTKLTSDNALEIIQKFDIICDCTDNFPSRYLINDACVILGKPNIYGSISRFEGQATVFNLDAESPNYRDLIPEPPPAHLLPSCVESGVMGVLPGLIGLIQATETIKIITGVGETLSGRLLVFDALRMKFRELKLHPTKNRIRISKLINYEEFCSGKNDLESSNQSSSIPSISIHELKEELENNSRNIVLIDVRNQAEFKQVSIKGADLIPLRNIESGESIEMIRKMIIGKKLYVHCKSGKRSLKALTILKESNINGVNVTGGIDAWTSEIMPRLNS